MQILLHLIRQELLAHRGLFVAWALAQTAQSIFGITGLAGEFHRAQLSQITDQVAMLLGLLHYVGIVLLPAAIALGDPPVDESAHWRTLPIHRRQLLAAKLASVAVAVVLPIVIAQTFTLTVTGSAPWTLHLLLDLLGYLPAWLAVGFCFGALAGNWKRFAVAITSLLVGIWLLIFLVGTFNHRSDASDGFEFFLLTLDKGLDSFLTNNLLLLGAGAGIIARYLTRLPGAWISILITLGIPASALVAPRLLASFIPAYKAHATAGSENIQVSIEQIHVVTNHGVVRWHGDAPFSALHPEHINPPQFLLPTRLETRLWTHNAALTSFTNIAQDSFHFAGRQSIHWWDTDAIHFQERHLNLPCAVPGMTILNPPADPGEGFRLFDAPEDMALRGRGAPMRLTTELYGNVGVYVKTGVIPLRVGSTLSTHGAIIRLTALLLDGGDKTQIKLNTRHVQFMTDIDDRYVNKSSDPRRRAADLRCILVNEKRREACLPSARQWSSQNHAYPLAFQTVVLDYAIEDGSDKNRPIDAAWMSDASLHVFRAMLGRRVALTNTFENIDIFAIPRDPLPPTNEVKER
jgi:hypothetical protein